MRKQKIVRTITLNQPVVHHMRMENWLGYKTYTVYAILLNADGQDVGVIAANEFGVDSLVGEDFWCFKENYTIKKFNVKKETAARDKMYSEVFDKKKTNKQPRVKRITKG